jgi:hypothetical protein
MQIQLQETLVISLLKEIKLSVILFICNKVNIITCNFITHLLIGSTHNLV